ncbi:hypothetical protein [Aurantiacibacter gangjinensis]|uniref:Uncharacterized protein n=1 Tax=Aurantiacibacter gangjinensis TaxID=502682 RepID=A0A0G9MR24_9SPHN|nr:hypothetical protein [Aurantiacibacter gangjinensis]APE28935.1 hypothetical protein BMF35_a2106 [Aurantiacibacter gangjinensis]KLE33059.1 hypothetical protein AAW01_03420 [Aurantiacibacter gangjinensis]
MKRALLLIGGAGLALSSSLAWASGPEDLLPPAFRDPPQATPTPTPAQPTPRPTTEPRTPTSQTPSAPNAPSAPSGSGGSSGSSDFRLPADFPSLRELEAMEGDEINDLFGLRPRFDIPEGARRAVEQVGVISQEEGGFPVASLAGQPAALVRAALQASDGPLVSRWGHILMRRALASRLDAPRGLNPVEFAALRAQALANMGEPVVARSLVQDVDGSEYNSALAGAAFDAYLGSGDLLGMCPVARLQSDLRDDGEWEMLQAVCSAYLGESRSANRRLDRALGTGVAEEIDVRLAQRFAGAAGTGGRAVNIEWEGVDELTPWRYSLARAVGEDLPEALGDDLPSSYRVSDVLIPATPLLQRVQNADTAAARGVISSAAMVDLYSQLWASDRYDAADKQLPAQLREAYVANTVADRVAAMRSLWGENADYGRLVLTAYAAARLPVNEALADDAGTFIASMLAAGLDRNALRWGATVPEGSQGWALLALAQPDRSGNVSRGAVDSYLDSDDSADMRKSAFLLAGLAGLGRIDSGDLSDFTDRVGVNLTRSSAWSEKISRAGELGNPALVSILAGLGMQGTSWDQMTPRHLYFITRALDQAGLSAEARMIAAEAVARG